MIWLEGTAIILSLGVLLLSHGIVVQSVSIMILSNAVAILAVDSSTEALSGHARVLAFTCILIGTALAAFVLLSHSDRSEKASK